jgi:hypothetical protein
MALIVEDGTIVPNANSYVTRSDYIIYAAAVGVTVADDASADVQLVKSAEYIGRHEANMKGYRTLRDQPIAFPRHNVLIDDWYWTGTEIPRHVILCQMAFALDINAGVDLYNRPRNPSMTNIVKSKRVEGAVSVVYADTNSSGQKLSATSTGDALLASLLENNGLSIAVERA